MTGGFLGWLAGFLGATGVEELHDRWADQLDVAPPGANGVLVDPALTGHRFPYWGGGSGGGVRGLTPTRSQADVIAAAHEGGAFLVADGLAALARVAESPTCVTVVGGVAKRAASLQLRADVWGVQVAGVSDGMATSRGTAILAGLASGAFASVGAAAQELVPEVETYMPVEDRTDVYRAMRQRWRSAFFGNDRIDLS
jgi:sugar (pentulose or hexulose) kinase